MGYTINSLAKKGDLLYFTTKEMAGLFEYDFNDNKLRIVSVLDDEHFTSDLYYNTVCVVNNCVVVGPGRGENFYLYKNGIVKRLDLPIELKKLMKTSFRSLAIKFNCAYVCNGSAYFVGWSVNAVVEIDVDKEIVTVYPLFETNTEYLCMSAGRNNNKLIIASRIGKTIYEFDMETKKYRNLGIELIADSWGAVEFNNKIYSYAVRNPGVFEWQNGWKNVLQGINEKNIKRVMPCNGALWIFLEESERIIILTESGHKTIELNKCIKIAGVDYMDERKIWITDIRNDEILLVDVIDGSIDYNRIPMVSNSDFFIDNVSLDGFMLNEGLGITLESYVKMLAK